MRLGERLRKLRRSKKFSAELLAEVCSVKAGAYRRWERNETEPSISQAIELARVYQMTLDNMLFSANDSASTIAVDVEPGQQVTIRILGNEARPKVKYQPDTMLGNALIERVESEKQLAE
ncbi:MAG TPA: XRE family transcriptional regulator [Alphaproteobacteria bacterium]|nr:XRE family transcriptional regulator [Alphaproteobacteria bacterium]